MKRYFVLAAAITIGVAGCTTYQPERDTTQPGKLRKSAFQDGSEWYMLTTVIDAPYEAGHTFPGEAGDMERIKWVVEEDTLYAYRTYEFVKGTEFVDQNGGIGEPVAAYAIQGHFDVWNQYNPVTGEQMPVKYEAKERPWWEREWVRVDFSKNQIDSFEWLFSQFCTMDGTISKDPVAYFPTSPEDPEQFYVAQRNEDGTWNDIYGWENIEAASEEGIDYLDVVNREFVHVNLTALFNGTYDSSCYPAATLALAGGQQVTYRHSFMKVPPSTFKPVWHPDAAFEKFGFFRIDRDVFDPERGITDFKEYYASIWNIWDDPSKPVADRGIRTLTWYYNPESSLPSTKACENGGVCIDYVDDTLYEEVADQWNEAFRDVLRAVGHPQSETAVVMEAKPVEYVELDQDGDGEIDVVRPKQNLGDIRYNLMWNHDTVSSSSPLGYGPSFTDPVTGEIISANANFYGGALRDMFGYLGDLYDVSKGNVTELEIMTGENVREYFTNLEMGNVTPPVFPVVDLEAMQAMKELHELNPHGDFGPTNPANLSPKQAELKRNLEQLKRFNPSTAARRTRAVGTPVEAELITKDMLALAGVDPDAELTEEILNKASPFRANSRITERSNEWSKFWASNSVLRADEFFNDISLDRVIRLAEEELTAQGKEVDKHNVIEQILKFTFVGVQAHEVGHTVGLRHNFQASFDEENYFPEYFEIRDPHGHDLPDIEWYGDNQRMTDQYDTNDDGILDGQELAQFSADRIARKREQEIAGTDFYQYSSIMDYSPHFYYNDIVGLGRYDHAALKFGYGNAIEVYSDRQSDFDPAEIEAAGGWESFQFRKLNRVDVPYYMGGERCNDTTECPQAFHALAPQKCRTNRGLGSVLTNGTEADLGVCSSIYHELKLKKAVNQVDFPDYHFCSDERRSDKPFCNVYDEGKSAVEIVENLIESYDRNYIFNNFRRYRGDTFQPYYYYRRIWGRYFVPIGIIHQSLLYNYYYNDGYAENVGPGGMLDTFLASRMAMNFFARVLSTPDVGTYFQWDPTEPYDGSYTEDCVNYGDGTMCVPLGIGKHLWSVFEDGYYGQIYRYARIGNFYDKLFAIEALTTRDWGLPDANDETYPINFYDSFPDEMLTLMSGIITEDYNKYAPVLLEKDGTTVSKIQYRDLWRGSFMGTPTTDFYGLDVVSGDPTPFEDRYDLSQGSLDAGGSIHVKMYSLLYSLFDFPIFFDMSYPNYVQLYSYGRPSAKDMEEVLQGEADGELISYLSPDRQMLYVVPATEDDRSIFWHLLETANEEKTRLMELRSYNGVAPDGFAARPENAACVRAYGIDPEATPDPGEMGPDEECLIELTDRYESKIDSTESFLRNVVDYLYYLGYSTR